MSTTPEFDVHEILAHPVRRLLIRTLHQMTGCSFTELMEVTGENTGSLSFHLRKVEPLVSQDEEKKYRLNSTGEKVYSALSAMENLEVSNPEGESQSPDLILTKGEKMIISSNSVRPLGHDHTIGVLTKSSLRHVNATLTDRRLILSSWRFFRPGEIQLKDVKLVRVRKDIPFTKGDSKGRSVEVTYSDASGKVHWVRFTLPAVQEWAKAIRDACSESSKPSS